MSQNPTVPRRRRIFRWTAILLVLLISPIFVLAATVAATGTVSVAVEAADGTDLYIPVPALLFDVGLWVLPRLLEPAELARIGEQIEPWRPALEEVAQGLASCPKGVLVDVKSGSEHVQVLKHWRTYEVRIDSPDTRVRVRLPARLLQRTLELFG